AVRRQRGTGENQRGDVDRGRHGSPPGRPGAVGGNVEDLRKNGVRKQMSKGSREQAVSVRDSILKALSRIRTTAQSRKATELPSAEFSNAINAVGEQFVDTLLQVERTGEWWLDETGTWRTCSVKRLGRRVRSNFIRGVSAECGWFPPGASRLADPM